MKRVTIVGAGAGSRELLAPKACQAVRESQVVFGAARLLEAFDLTGKQVSVTFSPQEISREISDSALERFCVVVSGDTGFYSLASSLTENLSGQAEVSWIPAVSSFSYMLSRLCKPWQDTPAVSLHGRPADIVPFAMNHSRLFVLTGGSNSVQAVCRQLTQAGMGFLEAWAGERLSYPEEKITHGRVEELAEMAFQGLSVLYLENPCYVERGAAPVLSDEDFLRGGVPMTKEEVRTLSLSKLSLKEEDVLYDVGAGTGSVAVQAALWLRRGRVYAVERKEEACRLIEENRERFGAYNLQLILGEAPNALKELPPPDCAFIGGSGGNLREILQVLLEKNPAVRVVINTVSLEGLTEALSCLDALNFEQAEVVSVNISKARQAGEYRLMTAQNPVHILSARGRTERNGETNLWNV